MRPLALELEGFGAFRDPVHVDFAAADLFAIVGATGHGKSTLIDAICFALYGKVPRHPKGEIAPVMTLGVNETKVSFTFEIAGSTFVATRVLRRDGNGKVQTKGRRFERMAGDMPELLGATEKEVEAAVQQHVGLDFGQFTKCVVLPQGDFAAFLHASAGDRVAILSALLDLGRYDRMGAAARERAKVAGARVGALADERARIGDATEEQLRDARERRDALVSLRADVDAAGPRDNELAYAIAEAQVRATAARKAAAALAVVEIPEAARTLAARIATAQADAETAANAADGAESEALDAEAERDRLPRLEALTDAVAAHRGRADDEARIKKGVTVIEERRAAVERAKDAVLAADTELEQLEQTLADAQHRHAHAELRSSLRVGEPCPVCEQDVAALPPKVRATELTAAKNAVAAQKKVQQQAQAASANALAEFRGALVLLGPGVVGPRDEIGPVARGRIESGRDDLLALCLHHRLRRAGGVVELREFLRGRTRLGAPFRRLGARRLRGFFGAACCGQQFRRLFGIGEHLDARRVLLGPVLQ
jgi:exonuclease SbcC